MARAVAHVRECPQGPHGSRPLASPPASPPRPTCAPALAPPSLQRLGNYGVLADGQLERGRGAPAPVALGTRRARAGHPDEDRQAEADEAQLMELPKEDWLRRHARQEALHALELAAVVERADEHVLRVHPAARRGVRRPARGRPMGLAAPGTLYAALTARISGQQLLLPLLLHLWGTYSNYKINKKLRLTIPDSVRTLTHDDVLSTPRG